MKRINLEVSIEIICDKGEFCNAELIYDTNQLVLKVQMDMNPSISEKLKKFNDSCGYSKLGKLVVCRNGMYDGHMVNIDFSKSALISYIYSGSTCDFYINEIRFSFSHPTSNNIARFNLNEEGHSFVQSYYDLYYFNPETLESRLPVRNPIDHNVLGISCSPKFNFGFSDGIRKRQIIIPKIPILEWNGFNNIEDVFEYNQWICLLASFFFNVDIDYKSAIIDCNNIRTYHIKVINEQKMLSNESLNDFIGFHNVADFIEKVSFEIFKEHKKSINMMIMRYLQSNYLEGASRYLILYGVLELGLKGQKACSEKFKNEERIKQIYENESLNAILEKRIIAKSEENEFKKRWIDVWKNIVMKPAPKEMLILFEKLNLDSRKIDEYINKECDENDRKKDIIIKLRNSITHGGFTHVKESINDILSLIVRVLILNKMGVNDVRICNSILYHDIIKS